MKVFHQAGHQTIWNLESFREDNTGDGVIFSPVHFASERLELTVEQEIKEVSLFDPQFYVPDSQKSKLHSYDFFPEKIMNGFSTNDYEAVAYEAAKLCLDFQVRNDFESIIIPARYFPELISDYVTQQKKHFVDPFLAAVERENIDKKVFLTLPMTAMMLMDEEFKTNLLNWVTAYPEIDGVYLLVNFNEPTKQLQNFAKFKSYLEFIQGLMEAELSVICGYCNTEGIIVAVLDVYAVTIGAYENTRGFSIDKFLENDQERRGPAPRIYLPKLLNWVRWDTAEEIREDLPGLWEKIYTPTEYSEEVVASGQRPHFSQPLLYKHHFKLLADQYSEIRGLSMSDRITLLQEKIIEASKLYEEIEDNRVIFFDSNCKGEHLPVWNRILRHLRTAL